MSEQLVADIQATRLLLQKRGWCQRDDERDGGELCLYVAAWDAVALRRNADGVDIRKLRAHLCAIAGVVDNIVAWNDTPGRTFDDILALLNKAEAAAREQ